MTPDSTLPPSRLGKWKRHIRVGLVLTAIKIAVSLAVFAYLFLHHHDQVVTLPTEAPAAAAITPPAD